MAKIQDIDIPYLEFAEAAAPGTPAAGIVRTYAKADGLMYQKDDAGTETQMGPGAGGIPATIFDAQGDLIVASAADTAARLALGASGTVLRSNGTTAAWATGLPIVAVVGSDHAISSTTATEVTLTPTPVLGAGTYMFIAHLILQTATTTVAPLVAINHTGTVTTFYAHYRYNDAAITASVGSISTASLNSVPFGLIHGSGAVSALATTTANMGPAGMAAINTNGMAVIEGIMVVSVSGDFELWHSSETASSTTVKAGSSIMILQTA